MSALWFLMWAMSYIVAYASGWVWEDRRGLSFALIVTSLTYNVVALGQLGVWS